MPYASCTCHGFHTTENHWADYKRVSFELVRTSISTDLENGAFIIVRLLGEIIGIGHWVGCVDFPRICVVRVRL